MARSRKTALPLALVFCLFCLGTAAEAQVVTKGYSTRLLLDPIAEGPGQRITGSGAPLAPAVFVELWRVPFGTGGAESVASAGTLPGGVFVFDNVDVNPGDSFFVTLSRSWHFNTDGDFEGWDRMVSPDAELSVVGGSLRVRVINQTGNMDPFFFNNFFYDSHFYRVIEIRLRNSAPLATSRLGVFFGDPWSQYMNRHGTVIPSAMNDFQTIMMPMNVDEARVKPPPVQRNLDGLWDTGRLNDVIRLDPLDAIPLADRPAAFGSIVEIDYIRIREDYRFDFDTDNDFMGLDTFNDVSQLSVAGGFLNFEAAAGAPSFFNNLQPDKLESGWFTRFVLGMDNVSVANALNSVAVNFNDDDSGTSYVDPDSNALQTGELALPFTGRQDAHAFVDDMTSPPGEWTEDGRVPVAGLEVALPTNAVAGDMIRLDYVGFVPTDPYGPSEAVFIPLPNNPPVAVIVPIPDPPVVVLRGGSAEIVLDGSMSDDGDNGTQGLSFSWAKVSGPAGDVIASPADPVTMVTFTALGEYVYELTVDDGQPVDSLDSATVTVTVRPPHFLRGDVDSNGVSLELNDAIHLTNFLFFADKVSAPITCHDAADVDDSGQLDLSDVAGILLYHRGFPAPFPAICGPDLTDDSLPECEYPEDLCVDASLSTVIDLKDKSLPKEERKSAKKEFKAARKLHKKARKEERKARRKARREARREARRNRD